MPLDTDNLDALRIDRSERGAGGARARHLLGAGLLLVLAGVAAAVFFLRGEAAPQVVD